MSPAVVVAGAGEGKPLAGGVDGDVGILTFVDKRVLLKARLSRRPHRPALHAVELAEEVDRLGGGRGLLRLVDPLRRG